MSFDLFTSAIDHGGLSHDGGFNQDGFYTQQRDWRAAFNAMVPYFHDLYGHVANGQAVAFKGTGENSEGRVTEGDIGASFSEGVVRNRNNLVLGLKKRQKQAKDDQETIESGRQSILNQVNKGEILQGFSSSFSAILQKASETLQKVTQGKKSLEEKLSTLPLQEGVLVEGSEQKIENLPPSILTPELKKAFEQILSNLQSILDSLGGDKKQDPIEIANAQVFSPKEQEQLKDFLGETSVRRFAPSLERGVQETLSAREENVPQQVIQGVVQESLREAARDLPEDLINPLLGQLSLSQKGTDRTSDSLRVLPAVSLVAVEAPVRERGIEDVLDNLRNGPQEVIPFSRAREFVGNLQRSVRELFPERQEALQPLEDLQDSLERKEPIREKDNEDTFPIQDRETEAPLTKDIDPQSSSSKKAEREVSKKEDDEGVTPRSLARAIEQALQKTVFAILPNPFATPLPERENTISDEDNKENLAAIPPTQKDASQKEQTEAKPLPFNFSDPEEKTFVNEKASLSSSLEQEIRKRSSALFASLPSDLQLAFLRQQTHPLTDIERSKETFTGEVFSGRSIKDEEAHVARTKGPPPLTTFPVGITDAALLVTASYELHLRKVEETTRKNEEVPSYQQRDHQSYSEDNPEVERQHRKGVENEVRFQADLQSAPSSKTQALPLPPQYELPSEQLKERFSKEAHDEGAKRHPSSRPDLSAKSGRDELPFWP